MRWRSSRAPWGALALAAAALAPRAHAEDLRLEKLVPHDTLAYLHLTDGAGCGAATAKTRAQAVFHELEPFFSHLWGGLAPAREQLEAQFEAESGIKVWDALALLGGGVDVAFMGIDPDAGAPRMALAIGMTGREDKVRGVLAALENMAGPGATHAHQGITVKAFGEPPVNVAEVGGKLLVTILPADLHGLIDRWKGVAGGSAAAPLAMHEGYVKAMARVTGGNPAMASLYVNVEGLMTALVLPQMGDGERHILTALGATDVKTIALAFTAAGDALASRVWVGAPVTGARGGVLGAFQHGAADRALARYAPKGATGVFLGKLDLAKLFDRAFALVGAVEPGAKAEAESGLAEVEGRLGFTLRADLLAPMGEDWMLTSFAPPGGGLPLTVVALKLRDAKAFVTSREKLAAGVGGKLETLTLDGRTYRYLHGRVGELGKEPFRDADDDPMSVASYFAASVFGQSWTIEGDTLFVADMPHTLADYFDVMKQGSIVDTPEWATATAFWPTGGQALGYSDPRGYFSGGYNLFVRILKTFEGIAREAGVPVDVNRLPRAQAIVRHLAPGINAITLDNEGLALETRATMGGIDETLLVAAGGGIVAAIAVPNLIQARRAANEAAAIASLRTLVTAQALYRDADMDGDGSANFAASLEALAERGIIDPVLGGGVKGGYMYTLERGEDGMTFKARAEPLEPGETGQRYFYVDESGVIRFNYWEPANEESYPLGG